MTPERYQRIVTVLNQRQPDLTVITEEVHKGRNIAAIVRTADAVDVDTMHSVIPEAVYHAYRGTALGSEKLVDVKLYPKVDQLIKTPASAGFQVVATHLSDTAIDYRDIDYTRPTALLMGTEKHGMKDKALSLVDQQVTIPILGMSGSFNVSVACAIIMTEARQQRERVGLYTSSRLPAAIYRKKLFCWCYPQLADYCHKHGLDHLEMKDNGDLVALLGINPLEIKQSQWA